MTPLKTYKLKLEAILDEQFPKLNADRPEIPSSNNRSAALVLFAHAVILAKELLKAENDETTNPPKEAK